MSPVALRAAFYGFDIWVHPHHESIIESGFEGSVYEARLRDVLETEQTPISRVEVHLGALILVYKEETLVPCRVVFVSDAAPPTLWARLGAE